MQSAMIATWVFGLAMLAASPGFLRSPWVHVKLLLLVGLTGFHLYIGHVKRRFAADDVFLTSRQCRMRNEIPTLFLIAIVLLAVLHPGG